jgi:hypothetical protein
MWDVFQKQRPRSHADNEVFDFGMRLGFASSMRSTVMEDVEPEQRRA